MENKYYRVNYPVLINHIYSKFNSRQAFTNATGIKMKQLRPKTLIQDEAMQNKLTTLFAIAHEELFILVIMGEDYNVKLMIEKEDFDNIVSLYNYNGITIAKTLGVTKQTISNAKREGFTMNLAEKFCEVLGLELNKYFTVAIITE